MNDRKEKILKACNGGIPLQSLLNYIEHGDVTLMELVGAGLSEERQAGLRQLMAAGEDKMWADVKAAPSVAACRRYMQTFPGGRYAGLCAQLIVELDEKGWTAACQAGTQEAFDGYLNNFPYGRHADDCRARLDDLPWMAACRTGTVEAYEAYRLQYPGRHTAEIDAALLTLSDDADWARAQATQGTAGYRNYLNLHPTGKHVAEAQAAIEAGAGRELILEGLSHDPNAYGAFALQTAVGRGVISRADLGAFFDPEATDAILNFHNKQRLPGGVTPERLQGGSTEFYFWGTPSSGKTCALGALLSRARQEGLLGMQECGGRSYMMQLANIFRKQGISTLPESTSNDTIQEMVIRLRDDKGKYHRMTLIDLAGEVFRAALLKSTGGIIDATLQKTLDTTLGYLNNDANLKVHFFVVEYGAHDRMWDGYSMLDYLDNMLIYLREQNIIRKSTAGVYVVVTKCDKISPIPAERPKLAFDYVQEELRSFWNVLNETCRNAGISEPKVLSFSVGHVLAQDLCRFDGSDTAKIIDKLLAKTRPEKSGFFGKVIDLLES